MWTYTSKLIIGNSTLINLTCVAVLSEVLYHIYKCVKRKTFTDNLTNALLKYYKQSNETGQLNKVLFFPDSGYICRKTLSGRTCRDKNCHAAHDDASLNCLLKVLQLSKKKIDVCVYMITCGVLADALVQCLERGVIIRVITEEKNSGEEGEMIGAQIGKLRQSGIPVLCSSSSYWMHHKFLLADDEVLVTGSFNWTNQAVLGNFENLVITSEKNLVQPFVAEYQRLWEKFSSPDIEAIEVETL